MADKNKFKANPYNLSNKLIQKNVDFNKLGMLIIDEEHKFGVNQKENIKQKEIDIFSKL